MCFVTEARVDVTTPSIWFTEGNPEVWKWGLLKPSHLALQFRDNFCRNGTSASQFRQIICPILLVGGAQSAPQLPSFPVRNSAWSKRRECEMIWNYSASKPGFFTAPNTLTQRPMVPA
ncbi:hypothetical protein DsansV1_C31g0216211 [Dioscorea sansibarensis]